MWVEILYNIQYKKIFFQAHASLQWVILVRIYTKKITEKKIHVDEFAAWKMIHEKITIHYETSYACFF